eukprot:GHVR01018392.1.p1 GENE.GHVR01018392.1~~GHVR01018392.1.p1  ORF type:complete len:279 (+),score=128.71 GHVR01018392.1:712-1548(+)
MPTFSRPVKVHPNGLICYGRGTREDGAHLMWTLGHKLKEAEAALSSYDGSDDNIMCQLELEVENALEAIADATADGYDMKDATGEGLSPTDDSDETRRRGGARVGELPDSFCTKNTHETHTHTQTSQITTENNPFTLDGVSTPSDYFLGRWVEADLRAGDMLYVPASWFHEVLSYPDDNTHTHTHTHTEDSSPSKKRRVDFPKDTHTCTDTHTQRDTTGHHLAINYWLYPPSSSGSFNEPYEDSFWSSITSEKLKRAEDMQSKHNELKETYTHTHTHT